MADPNDNNGGDPNASPESRLQEVLAARWDPTKLSTLMRRQEAMKGQRLDYSQRSRFEGRLGVDLGDVRIFTGELADEITQQHNAEALTIGNTGMILMRNSQQWAQGTAAGTSLLAHELTHVAQGKSGSIARKAVTAELAHEDASEAEAEMHEAAVHAEEMGHGPPVPGAVKSSAKQSQDKKKEKLLDKILELFDEDRRMQAMRLGLYLPEV